MMMNRNASSREMNRNASTQGLIKNYLAFGHKG
jgi:hypothetical protein